MTDEKKWIVKVYKVKDLEAGLNKECSNNLNLDPYLIAPMTRYTVLVVYVNFRAI